MIPPQAAPSASLIRRAAAQAIDCTLCLMLAAVAVGLVLLTRGSALLALSSAHGPAYVWERVGGGTTVTVTAIALAWLLWAFQQVLGVATVGTTLGKFLLEIRVENAAGAPPSIQHSLYRHAGWYVSVALGGLGILAALFNEQRRALHDWLVDAYVLYVPRPTPHPEASSPPAAPDRSASALN